MTYAKLARMIANMTPEQQEMDVKRFDGNDGEFYRLGALTFYDKAEFDSEELPDGTPYLEA